MAARIDVILPYDSKPDFFWNLDQFSGKAIHSVVVPYTRKPEGLTGEIESLAVRSFTGGVDLTATLELGKAEFILMVLPGQRIRLHRGAVERFLEAGQDSEAGLIYSDYSMETEYGEVQEHPVIDYQAGSLRDGFDFGPVLFFSRKGIDRSLGRHGSMDRGKWSGLYDLRLKVSIGLKIIRIPEFLMTRIEPACPNGDLGLFDYLCPEKREFQIEMERVATSHLRRIGAFLEPRFEKITKETRPVTASVIIPVKNRENTVGQAVESALAQEADFDYNVIAVDNHSTDKTPSILESYAGRDHRLIHLIPARRDLLIGGCWNEAIRSAHCGTYAVQLDSDDLYADRTTLQTMVRRFNDGDYAMVVGAYRTTDFQLREIPPGVVDHREWTRENGRNNLLRVNGVGAPRAYYTPFLRRLPFPNVSYGEDYAVALRLSRQYEIGRIFDPLYICRRWQGNTDACLSIEASNRNDAYKDGLRTLEILERQKWNREEE